MCTLMQYAWRYETDASRDLVMVEIRRKVDGEEPFTVLLHHFSECGFAQLFSDLFYSDDWDVGRGANGETSSDIRFLIGLWREFGLEEENGPFHPKHINLAMDRYPLVYRRCLEDVMSQKYGCGHSEIIEELCPTNPITESSPHVVKLDFDINDSDEQIEQKIKHGFELGKSMIDR